MRAWKVIFAVLVIFCAGAVTGSLSLKLYENQARLRRIDPRMLRGPGWPQRAELLRRLERELKLTPDQHQRIELILRQSQERVAELWDQVAPQVREEFQLTHERIRSELTPEQRKQFEALSKRGRGKPEGLPGRYRMPAPRRNPPALAPPAPSIPPPAATNKP